MFCISETFRKRIVKLSSRSMLASSLTLVNCSHILSLRLSHDINNIVGQKNTAFSNKEKILKLILTLQMIATTQQQMFTHIDVFLYVKNVHLFLCLVSCIYGHWTVIWPT
jgi:hypothetical protein